MTTDEFVAELKKYGVKFEARGYEGMNYFRTKDDLCPICALIKAKGIETNMAVINENADILGKKILDLNNSYDIIEASDLWDACLDAEQLRIKKAFEEMVI